MNSIQGRYDFVYLFDCKDGNPNGDPDAANAPRVDPQDMHGLVSDVCLKRKIRNYVLEAGGGAEPFDIFVRQGAILNDSIAQAHKDLGHKVDGKSKKATRDQVKDAPRQNVPSLLRCKDIRRGDVHRDQRRTSSRPCATELQPQP